MRDRRQIVASVFFDRYHLGQSADLVASDLQHDVTSQVRALGIRPEPQISLSEPHQQSRVDHARKLWRSPTAAKRFIADAMREAKVHGYGGYSIDLAGPGGDATADDTANYALFVGEFSQATASKGLRLTLRMPSRGSHDVGAMLKAAPGLALATITSTYTSNLTSFAHALNEAVAAAEAADGNVDRLAIGLSTQTGSGGGIDSTMPVSDLRARLDLARTAGVRHIDIWRAPIPEKWWPLLHDFVVENLRQRLRARAEDGFLVLN